MNSRCGSCDDDVLLLRVVLHGQKRCQKKKKKSSRINCFSKTNKLIRVAVRIISLRYQHRNPSQGCIRRQCHGNNSTLIHFHSSSLRGMPPKQVLLICAVTELRSPLWNICSLRGAPWFSQTQLMNVHFTLS